MQEWKLKGVTPRGSKTTDSNKQVLYIDLASSENESEVDASELKINNQVRKVTPSSSSD